MQRYRVVLSCAAIETHCRTIEVSDLQALDPMRPGWSSWRDQHGVQVGYLQCGSCCQVPQVARLD